MSRDYEPISTDGRQGVGLRVLLSIALVAFVGGIILTGWLATRYDLFVGDENSTQQVAGGNVGSAPDGKSVLQAGEATTASGLSMRVADLENRLSRINVQAEAASGNAARAEGLLIAFATRRAIEQGRPLGYLDQQLQLRFGASEPQAVRTIREFSAAPVVLEQLRSRLDEMGETLRTEGDGGFFDRISHEFSELFLIRKQGVPPTASADRLRRARRLVEAGNIGNAIAEIEEMPGAADAQEWIADAKRYKAAQEALAALEASAIFEPRSLRDSYGANVTQPSPLPPAQADSEKTEPEKPRKQRAPAAGAADEGENFFGF